MFRVTQHIFTHLYQYRRDNHCEINNTLIFIGGKFRPIRNEYRYEMKYFNATRILAVS